jgi:hypothetical protein
MQLRSGRQNQNENQANQPNVVNEAPRPIQVQNQASTQTVTDAQYHFDQLYKDLTQPGAFTSKLLRYLRKNRIHSLHRQKRHIFPRRKIVTRYPGNIIQSDLIDMQKYSTKNSGYNFILVVIDCFSKKLWTRPLKTKRGDETAKALRSIFLSMKYQVQSIIFDEGLEYVNKYVKMLLNEYNIHSYHIKTKLKASSAERVNRTIKEQIWKHFTETRKQRWIDVIDDICENYNNTFHTTIKMTPNEVTWDNREKVFKTMFPHINDRITCRLKVGDKVRVALQKEIFEKGYTQNWSDDIFTIARVFQKNRVCWYRIKDSEGNIYPKSKYFYQLNKVE